MEDKHIHEHHECDFEGHEHHHHADGSCCCHKHEAEFHGPNKPLIARIVISAVFYLAAMVLPLDESILGILTLLAAILVGYDILWTAIKNLFQLRFFDEYFLMSFAAVAACIIGEYEEGAAVLLLYRIGEAFQDHAIRRSRRTISSLTGQYCAEGSEKSEKFITKFSAVYTPVILASAILIAVCLPLFSHTSFADSVYRALTFLVVACPCAIVISVPLAYFAGIGAASRKMIFFRDSTAVDSVASGKCHPVHQVGNDGHEFIVLTSDEHVDVSRADVVCHGNSTDAASLASTIARRTRVIVYENIIFTIILKCAVIVLGALGISSLWFAVFADSGVAILATLNSLRAFKIPKS